ncbi:MAG: hypothetical protein ABIN58_12645 [candidate division WOR-3 bacterium]
MHRKIVKGKPMVWVRYSCRNDSNKAAYVLTNTSMQGSLQAK